MRDHLHERFPPHSNTLASPFVLALSQSITVAARRKCIYLCADWQDVLDQTQNLNYRSLSWVAFLEVRLFVWQSNNLESSWRIVNQSECSIVASGTIQLRRHCLRLCVVLHDVNSTSTERSRLRSGHRWPGQFCGTKRLAMSTTAV